MSGLDSTVGSSAASASSVTTASPSSSTIASIQRNHTTVLFDQIQSKLEQAGLSDRVQLFFLNIPRSKKRKQQNEDSIIIALPSTVVPDQAENRTIASRLLIAAAIIGSVVETSVFSISWYALNTNFFSSVINEHDLSVLSLCTPVFVGVFALQLIHELAHRLAARRRKMRVGLPVPLPSFPFGFLGCITPLRSFPRNQASLFDFAISGPLAGILTSLALVVGGLLATVHSTPADLAKYPMVPVAMLKGSFLTGSMLSFFLPKALLLPAAQPVAISPLFVIGFTGLFTNALNMLPIGRLDGGRAYRAVFGTKSASLASPLSFLTLALLAISSKSLLSLFWAIYILLFQQKPEIPVRNDVTEVDDTRVVIYLVTLLLSFLTLTPFSGGMGFL